MRDAYQYIEAAERADMATEALGNTDARVSGPDDSDASGAGNEQ